MWWSGGGMLDSGWRDDKEERAFYPSRGGRVAAWQAPATHSTHCVVTQLEQIDLKRLCSEGWWGWYPPPGWPLVCICWGDEEILIQGNDAQNNYYSFILTVYVSLITGVLFLVSGEMTCWHWWWWWWWCKCFSVWYLRSRVWGVRTSNQIPEEMSC